MKTIHNTTRWLGLVLAGSIITLAASGQAGKPVKPPPEPPPPSGPAYVIVAVGGGINPWSLSDVGALVGSVWYSVQNVPGGLQVATVLPPRIIDDGPQYLASDIRWLPPSIDGTQKHGDCMAMNVAGIAVGYVYPLEDPTPNEAIMWLPDGTPVDLSVSIEEVGSAATDVNDAGLVLVGSGYENQEGEGGGVVVPLDLVGGDGAPDTWFTDVDADGINDLFFLTDAGHNLLPLAINEAGQVLAAQVAGGTPVAGYLLTPDFTDEDKDGNPWFADAQPADGFNDRLIRLESPVAGAGVFVGDLNNLGQVAGNSGGHAVLWEFDEEGEQVSVADLGSLGDKVEMTATGISDSGRIVGTSRIRTGQRSKAGPSWLIEIGNETPYELLPLMVNSDGWSDLRADGINRHGWIHGHGMLDGVGRNFVAIPVEEP